MDINFENSTYPRKVEIVNNPNEPLTAQIENLPLTDNDNLSVEVPRLGFNLRPHSTTLFNVYLDNILLLQSDGTFVPIPLNSFYLSVNQSQINNLLASYKTAYTTLVSGVTAATLHYSKQTSTGSVTSDVYNLKD